MKKFILKLWLGKPNKAELPEYSPPKSINVQKLSFNEWSKNIYKQIK